MEQDFLIKRKRKRKKCIKEIIKSYTLKIQKEIEDSLRKDVPISITVSALGNVFAKLTAKYKFEKNRVLEEMSKALDYYNEEEEEK